MNRSTAAVAWRRAREGRIAPETRRLLLDELVGVAREVVPGLATGDDLETTIEAAESAPDIDAVYTWVDGADPDWQAAFRRHQGNNGLDHDARFRDHGELQHSLRSVFRYAPWFRRIHIVTNGGRPSWLVDDPNVTVVPHRQIMPSSALPTFNSHAIEANLHRIPGLTERFVYFNDDFFLARPVRPSTWFDEPSGAIRIAALSRRAPSDDTPGMYTATAHTRQVLDEHGFSVDVRLLAHAPYALRRSHIDEIERMIPDEFERTTHRRVRHLDDISVAASLAPWYSEATGRAVPSTSPIEYVSVGHPTTGARLRRLRRFRSFDSFCLNWTERTSPDAEAMVRRFLASRFPDPAPWERTIG